MWQVPLSKYVNQPAQPAVLHVYELLSDGQCMEWKTPPIPEDGFRFWSIQFPTGDSTLTNINFVRPPEEIVPAEPPKVPQDVLDQLAAAGLTEEDAANMMSEGNQYV